MSGVFGHRFGRKNSRTRASVSSVKYFVSSHFVSRHAKYVYDCVKPSFRQPVHHLRPRERLRQKDHVRMLAANFARSPTPRTRNGFVCGLSTRKIRTPSSIQNRKTLFSSSHSDCQASRLEIERIDVLIFLRRILGVLNRAVGPLAKPLGMLADVRMIGRASETRCPAPARCPAAPPPRTSRRKSSIVPSCG